jgi:hypothetical protein
VQQRLALEYFNFIVPCYFLVIGVEMVPEDHTVRHATRTVSQDQDTSLVLMKPSLESLFGKWDILSPAGRRVVESCFLVGFGCPAGRVFGLRWFDAQTPTQPQRVEVKLGSQGKEVQGPEAKETPVTPSNASCVILSFSSCGGDDDDDMNLCFEGT